MCTERGLDERWLMLPSSRNAMVFQAVSLGMPADIETKI
jgi:hypothetical protein